jgi:hypothetical protein
MQRLGVKPPFQNKNKNIRILEENEGNQKLMFGTEPSILLLEIPSDAHLRASKKKLNFYNSITRHHPLYQIVNFCFTRLSLTSSKELELTA